MSGELRETEWHVYVCGALSETNSAWQTEQKGEREGTRDKDNQRGGAYMAGNPSSIRRSLSLQPTPFITKVVVRQPLRQSCMNSPSHTVQQILIYTLTERFLK